jgi:hypothetical protein
VSEASTADFIERRWLRDWASPDAAMRDATEELKTRGATFLRSHVTRMTRELIVEGWIEHPGEQGDCPL